jgi:hypothetical protein
MRHRHLRPGCGGGISRWAFRFGRLWGDRGWSPGPQPFSHRSRRSYATRASPHNYKDGLLIFHCSNASRRGIIASGIPSHGGIQGEYDGDNWNSCNRRDHRGGWGSHHQSTTRRRPISRRTARSRFSNSSITTSSGWRSPSNVSGRPRRIRYLPPKLAMLAGASSRYFSYCSGSVMSTSA